MAYPLDPVALTTELVRIPSANPALVPGAMGEAAIAGYCEAWLRHHGLETHRLESEPGRPSVVGIARGSGGGHSLMLNGHFDTVTLAGYDGDPLDPRIEDGKLYGRGAFDMKGGLAAAMLTAARAATFGLRGDVIVACVADEEHASRGTAEVLRHFTADMGIVTEPSHLEITLAHKGFVWFDVIVEGRAAHGSRPELGIDAIALAGHLLVAIGEWHERLAANLTHPALGAGSVHASLIRGGEEASSYPASCTVTIERRTVPGESADTVEAELRSIIDGIAARVPAFRARIERGLERRPFETDPGHPLVETLTRHTTAARGNPPGIRAEPFWTDCALMQDAGIAVVMFGPDGAGAHAATEWVTTSSLTTLTDILTATVTELCR